MNIWNSLIWNPGNSGLPSGLFIEHSSLTTNNQEQTCEISWPNTSDQRCTLTLPGNLPGTISAFNVSILIQGGSPISLAHATFSTMIEGNLTGSLQPSGSKDSGTLSAMPVPPADR
jgi:hypothetical protein